MSADAPDENTTRIPPVFAGLTPAGSTRGLGAETVGASTHAGVASESSQSETTAEVAPEGQVAESRVWSARVVRKMFPAAAGFTGSWMVREETGALEVFAPPRVNWVARPATARFEAGEKDFVGWVASCSGTSSCTDAVLGTIGALSATICEVF